MTAPLVLNSAPALPRQSGEPLHEFPLQRRERPDPARGDLGADAIVLLAVHRMELVDRDPLPPLQRLLLAGREFDDHLGDRSRPPPLDRPAGLGPPAEIARPGEPLDGDAEEPPTGEAAEVAEVGDA